VIVAVGIGVSVRQPTIGGEVCCAQSGVEVAVGVGQAPAHGVSVGTGVTVAKLGVGVSVAQPATGGENGWVQSGVGVAVAVGTAVCVAVGDSVGKQTPLPNGDTTSTNSPVACAHWSGRSSFSEPNPVTTADSSLALLGLMVTRSPTWKPCALATWISVSPGLAGADNVVLAGVGVGDLSVAVAVGGSVDVPVGVTVDVAVGVRVGQVPGQGVGVLEGTSGDE
jgi:hypothetical protein